jgi:hypothetical protein
MRNCPVGAERESVAAKRKTKPKRAAEKPPLLPAKFEDVVRAFMQTPLPPTSKKAKK